MATVQQARASAQEQRILLRNVSWATYEHLLADHEDASAPRFTYDRGELEIMSPLPQHEDRTWATERIIEEAILHRGQEFRNARSSTFRRQDLERGFEPDTSFYVENEAAVRHSVVFDLSVDPPPDLVVEIDVTSSSIDKLALFAAIGVPEVWRHANGRFTFLHLTNGEYVVGDESRSLPGVTAAEVSTLVNAVGTTGRAAWLTRVREWARTIADR